MSLAELVDRYIASSESVFPEIVIMKNLNADASCIRNVVDSAKAYLADAKYYRDKRKLEVSLASVAYCEGLLDALRLLGAVKFEWSTRKKERKEP